jgi:hypothetical protein
VQSLPGPQVNIPEVIAKNAGSVHECAGAGKKIPGVSSIGTLKNADTLHGINVSIRLARSHIHIVLETGTGILADICNGKIAHEIINQYPVGGCSGDISGLP